MGTNSDILVIYHDAMGTNSIILVIYHDAMGTNSIILVNYHDAMGTNSDILEISLDSIIPVIWLPCWLVVSPVSSGSSVRGECQHRQEEEVKLPQLLTIDDSKELYSLYRANIITHETHFT